MTLADLIGELRMDAVRVAREKTKKSREPYHAAVGKRNHSCIPEHHLLFDSADFHHAALLHEERSHPDL